MSGALDRSLLLSLSLSLSYSLSRSIFEHHRIIEFNSGENYDTIIASSKNLGSVARAIINKTLFMSTIFENWFLITNPEDRYSS